MIYRLRSTFLPITSVTRSLDFLLTIVLLFGWDRRGVTLGRAPYKSTIRTLKP
jgi:hypothetical protein